MARSTSDPKPEAEEKSAQDTPIQRFWRHPVVRWTERIFWVAVALFAINRLGPQLSAWTGIGPTLGQAPAFSVTTLDGSTLTSDDLRGRTVVLNFWATWCLPCRLEMPALQALHDEMDPDQVQVIGISVDVTRGPVADYLAEHEITYPIGMASGELRRAMGGITAVPTTFIIDPDGVIQHRVLGYFAPPAMRAAVRRAVEAQADRLETQPPG